MRIKGIDVSRWQGSVDWKKAAASGVRFAMIKALQGERPDPRFMENAEGAIKNGVHAGAYVYSLAADEAAAIREAEAALDLCSEYELRYPVALDFENEHFRAMTKAARGRVIEAFMGRIAEGGRIPILYSNHDWLTRLVPKSVLEKHYIWLAWWRSDKPAEDYSYAMWQRGTGKVDGIEGEVDIDVSFIDFAGLTGAKLPLRVEEPSLKGEGYRAFQRALALGGYTDEEGLPPKEDGVWGKRSQQAMDQLVRVNF